MDVKELRKKLNLTQHELSAVSGIPRDRIAKWEQGKGSPKGNDYQILTNLEKTANTIENLREEMGETAKIIPAVRFGITVKAKREKDGKTWEDLGTELDVLPILIQCAERGLMEMSNPDLKPLWAWAGISMSEIEAAMQRTPATDFRNQSKTDGQEDRIDPDFHAFLKSNDAFFKNQYTAFNTQVLANLTALQTYAKNLEALLKINLEHTGNIEAHQLGVKPAEVHERINRDILAAAGVQMDMPAHSPRKG